MTMRLFFAIIFSFFTSSVVFTQTKIAEAKGFDDGSTEVRKLVGILKINPESSGFIIIHSDKTKEKLGNIRAFIEGVRKEIELELGKESVNKIAFANIIGKENLFKEFWVIPKDKKKPFVKEVKIDLNELKAKYLYASLCSECVSYAPIISAEREDFKPFADALKSNPEYKGLIISHSHNPNWSNEIRNGLVREFDLNDSQIQIELKDPLDFPHPIHYFYLIPNNQKKDYRNF